MSRLGIYVAAKWKYEFALRSYRQIAKQCHSSLALLLRPEKLVGQEGHSFHNFFLCRSLLNEAIFQEPDRSLTRRNTKFHKSNLIMNAASARDVVQFIKFSIEDGVCLHKADVKAILLLLRNDRRYATALPVAKWMKEHFEFSSADHAILLDLISKVNGLAAAEKYFKNLSEPDKGQEIYSTLLHSYVQNRMIEDAERVMQKMHSLGLTKIASPYNEMMILYISTYQLEKVSSVIQTLKRNDVPPDAVTYNLWLKACIRMSDFDTMEKIAMEIKCGGESNVNWSTYCKLAFTYIHAGIPEKAYPIVTKLESFKIYKPRCAYDRLISLYQHLGSKEGIYRVWRSIKEKFHETSYSSFFTMHYSLVQLGDIEGAEKIFDEWMYIRQSSNIAESCEFLNAYIDAGLFEIADTFHRKLVEGDLRHIKWEAISKVYVRNDLFHRAVVALSNAFSEAKHTTWKPKTANILSVLKHFESEADMDAATACLKLLQDYNYDFRNAYNSLLRTHVNAGRTEAIPAILKQMKSRGIKPNKTTHQIVRNFGSSV